MKLKLDATLAAALSCCPLALATSPKEAKRVSLDCSLLLLKYQILNPDWSRAAVVYGRRVPL
jgi:hypothetical protein